jgi:hypothetical protein
MGIRRYHEWWVLVSHDTTGSVKRAATRPSAQQELSLRRAPTQHSEVNSGTKIFGGVLPEHQRPIRCLKEENDHLQDGHNVNSEANRNKLAAMNGNLRNRQAFNSAVDLHTLLTMNGLLEDKELSVPDEGLRSCRRREIICMERKAIARTLLTFAKQKVLLFMLDRNGPTKEKRFVSSMNCTSSL